MTVPLAELSVEQLGDVVVARLVGEIDMSNATELGQALGRALTNEATGLVVDLAEVSYLDSAGIRIVYELRARLQARGQELWLAVPDGSPIADALRVAHVTVSVGTAQTAEAAVESLRER